MSHGFGRGGEGEHPGGLGARPLVGGPVAAGIGIEIAGVDLRGEAMAGAQEAIGARERLDRVEIGVARIVGDPRGEEQPGARGAFVAVDQIEEAVEFGGDEPRGLMRRLPRLPIGEAIEAREHRRGETVVEAVAGDGVAVLARQGFDLPVDRAGEERVGDLVARDQRGGAPAEREPRPRGAPPQRIGRRHRHADLHTGGEDGVPLGNRLEEGALSIGGPPVIALRAIGERGQGGRV